MNAPYTANDKKALLTKEFENIFGHAPEHFFSAPGRVELGGNHTDHQRGCVLAAAVDREALAAVSLNKVGTVRLHSEGYSPVEVELSDLAPRECEKGTTAGLIRGVLAEFERLGAVLGGFDAYVTSTVPSGSGLSSSAAFEVLLGSICNSLFFGNRLSAPRVAKLGQTAENVYFGKPCGLMDQTASAVGGLLYIDFERPSVPSIRQLDFDFSACGHTLCIIDTKSDHADLTADYASIPAEMGEVCRMLGVDVLRELPEAEFYRALPRLRTSLPDRALLRAIHFYSEQERVAKQAAALLGGDFDKFLRLVRESGQSSWMYLQNITPEGNPIRQSMALTLALCHRLLGERGAFRVHGGGFAGTALAFVPDDMLNEFCIGLGEFLGEGAVTPLSVRREGGIKL